MGDLTTLTNEVPSQNRARLPALAAPELSVDYLAQIKEIIEVLLGRRGSSWDRAVTFRDLQAGGLGNYLPGGASLAGATYNPATGQVVVEPGSSIDIDEALKNSAAYKRLLSRIGSVDDLADLPEQIRQQLEQALASVARERGAAVRDLQDKIQNQEESVAWRLQEVTAALGAAAAGVREYSAAYADQMRAVALKVTLLEAAIDNGSSVEIEERFQAIASEIDGLQGQWSLKIQANPVNGQPPVIAGIALSVDSPIAGLGTSALIFMADKFGFYTANGTQLPFSIVGNKITFNGEVRINGQLVIGPDGLQEGFEAPDTKNSELAPTIDAAGKAVFSPKRDATWEFRNSLDGWALSGLGSATGPDSFDCTANNSAPAMFSPTFAAVNGAIYDKIRMRVLRINDLAGQWRVAYATTGHGLDAIHFKEIPDATKVGEWVILEWDMSALPDWRASQITRIRIDVGTTTGGQFAIDWVSIGKYGPTDIRDLGMAGDLDATRGAPTGTPVGGTDAGLVASRALAGESAYNALAGINTALDSKLSTAGNQVLSGPVTLQSAGALVVGNTTNGVITNTSGIVVRENGQTTVALTPGGVAVKADISGSTGTFGNVVIGSTASFGQTAYDTGTGGFIRGGTDPAFSMRSAGGQYIRIRPSTNVFEINGVTLVGVDLSGSKPVTNAGGPMTNNFPRNSGLSRVVGSRTISVSGGTAPYSYRWTADAVGGSVTLSGAATATVTVSATTDFAPNSVYASITCTVTDANGLSDVGGFEMDATWN